MGYKEANGDVHLRIMYFLRIIYYLTLSYALLYLRNIIISRQRSLYGPYERFMNLLLLRS